MANRGKGSTWKRPKGGWGYTEEGSETTVVLTGLPKTLNAEILLSLLDDRFLGCYDYFYLPMDVDKLENTGLAYINFREHDKAVECHRYFHGFNAWPGGHFSERICKASFSSIQGYERNIEKQQNLKDWVNCNMPEDCKPMVFDEHGTRLPTMDVFPPPHETGADNGWRNYSIEDSYGSYDEGKRWKDEWYGGGSGDGYQSSTGRNGKFGSWSDKWRKDEWWQQSENSWHKDKQYRDRKWDRDRSEWETNLWESRRDRSWDTWDNAPRQVLLEGTSNEWSGGSRQWQTKKYQEEYVAEDTSPVDDPSEEPSRQEESVQTTEYERNESTVTAGTVVQVSELLPKLNEERRSESLKEAETSSSSKEEPEVLVSLAVTRYACPCCSACFAKWSACHHHILSEQKCRKEVTGSGSVEPPDLQAKCKEKAEELPTEQKNGKVNEQFKEDAIETQTRRFQ